MSSEYCNNKFYCDIQFRRTALMHASSQGYRDIVEFLVDQGADIHTQDYVRINNNLTF